MLAAAVAAVIFLLDAFTRDDLAVASLYALVPLIAANAKGSGRDLRIIAWAGACGVLSLIGYAIFQARGAPPLALAHLAISVSIILLTTLLLLRTNAMNSAMEMGERRYRTIFDTLSVAIWEHDFSPVAAALARLRDGGVVDVRRYVAEHPEFVVEMRRLVRITDVNATALAMMGVASKAAFFASLSEFLPETDESFADCILAIDERRPLFQAETMVTRLSGDPRQIIVAFGLGPDADLTRVPGSILDITARRTLELQVLRTREDLAAAQRSGALAAMSASIAHELNQPMSAIHSYADAARRWMSRSPPDMHEASAALTGLVQAVGHARTVMHRVRSLVGSARVELAEIELGEIVETAAALMRRDAQDADARLTLCDHVEGPVRIMGDRILLKQVFVNLIANAIQAMSEIQPDLRMVTLDLHVRGDSAVVEVADRGCGWAEVPVSKAFDSFYTTKRNGMGLGLSISRTTVERHGGIIRLKQKPEGGAIVEVVLPLASSMVGGAAADGDRDGVLEKVSV